jgi:hypothetical protein
VRVADCGDTAGGDMVGVATAGGGRGGLIGHAAAGVEVTGELRLCLMRAAACGRWRCCWSSFGCVVNGLLPSSLSLLSLEVTGEGWTGTHGVIVG